MVDRTLIMLFRAGTVGLCLLVGTFAYWVWLDNPDVITNSKTTITNTLPIKGDDKLRINVAACLNRPLVLNSGQRSITNDYIYVSSDDSVGQPGCFDRKRVLALPPGARPGLHKYQFCAEAKINPIKTRTVCDTPVYFNIE